MDACPKLLVTGFGPFPGAPENPTEKLVRELALKAPQSFGASALHGVVLPTEYRRSWDRLRRLYARHAPDVVVHFGLSGKATAIIVEGVGRCGCDSSKPDAAGYAPRRLFARHGGRESLVASLPANAIVARLKAAGIVAELSDDAGGYVCNATLYRSLNAAPADRMVGFIHMPPARRMNHTALVAAAEIILRAACDSWKAARQSATAYSLENIGHVSESR
jgi:pyroglutamyl-peptidase